MATSTRCAKCGTDSRQVARCELLGGVMCWRCYTHATTLVWEIDRVLDDSPTTRGVLAVKVGRDPRDGSVGRALGLLLKHGLAGHETDGYTARRGLAAPATAQRPVTVQPYQGRRVGL